MNKKWVHRLIIVGILGGLAFPGYLYGERNFLQTWQMVQDSVLTSLGLANRTSLQDIFVAVDKELNTPFALRASVPIADSKLNINSNQVEKGDGSIQTTAPFSDVINIFPASTVDYQSGVLTGGIIEVEGSTFVLPSCVIGNFRRHFYVYNSLANKLDSKFSIETATIISLENPGVIATSLNGSPVGYIDLECTTTGSPGVYKTAGSITNIIENKVGSSSTIFRFGSGSSSAATVSSGGGLNDLSNSNPDCELVSGGTPLNWTATGGLFTQSSLAGELINGVNSCKWDSSASGQILDSTLVAITPRNLNKSCLIQLYYRYPVGTLGDYTVQVFDGTNPLISPFNLSTTTNPTAPAFEKGLKCPSSGSYRIRITSAVANADPIVFDDAYLGSDKRIGEQAFKGWRSYTYDPAGLIGPNIITTLGGFAHLGSVFQPFQSSNGVWFLRATFGFNHTSGSNGTVTVTGVTWKSGVEYDQAAALRSGGQANSISGTSNISIGQTATTRTTLMFTWELDGKPTWATDTVGFETVTLDNQDWYIDVNLGGANYNLGTAAVSSYSHMVNSGIDLVINPGSAPAQIPCQTPTPSSGLDCGGISESNGVVFDIPRQGFYNACAAFGWQGSATTKIEAAFQIVETGNTNVTLVQEGKTRVSAIVRNASTMITPFGICGIFTFSPGQKTLRLMYEQAVTTATGSDLMADRSAATGQRDVHWTVYPLNSGNSTVAITPATTTVAGGVFALKQYTEIDVTVTGGAGLQRATFIPYQTIDGSWRIRFTILGGFASAASGSWSVTGMTSKNITNGFQPASAKTNISTWATCNSNVNSSVITWNAGSSSTSIRCSGDIELESKPTWAD